MDAIEDFKTLGKDLRSFPSCVLLHSISLTEGLIMAATTFVLAMLDVAPPKWLIFFGLCVLVVFASWRAFQHERRLRLSLEQACVMGGIKVAEAYADLLKHTPAELRHSDAQMIECLQKAGASKFTNEQQFREMFGWLEERKFPHPWQHSQYKKLPPLAFFQFANQHVINFSEPGDYSRFWAAMFYELSDSDSPFNIA